MQPFWSSWKSFYKFLFNSIFRTLTLLNFSSRIRPQCYMLHLLKSGGEGGGLGPLFLNFLDPPLICVYSAVAIHTCWLPFYTCWHSQSFAICMKCTLKAFLHVNVLHWLPNWNGSSCVLLFSNLTDEMLCKSLMSQFVAHIFHWNNEPCIVDPNETKGAIHSTKISGVSGKPEQRIANSRE